MQGNPLYKSPSAMENLLFANHSTKTNQLSELDPQTHTFTMNRNPFGLLTNMGPGQEPRYNTFALPGRDPYGLPPGVGPREPRYNPWYDPWPRNGRDYNPNRGFSSQGVDRMQRQYNDLGWASFEPPYLWRRH